MALIKCPDCGTDVSSAAPTCPKCGRPIAATKSVPQKKKTSGCAVVALALIVLVVIGAIFGHGNESSSPAGGSSEPVTATPPPAPRPVTKISADQLFNAYNNNEVATDEALKGTDVEVTGRVQEIAKDFTDSVVISLATSNEFMPARMNMEDSERAHAATLRAGNTVSITCHRMARVIGSPAGSKCTFSPG